MKVSFVIMYAITAAILIFLTITYIESLKTSAVLSLFLMEMWFIFMILYAVDAVDRWKRNSIVWRTTDIGISFLCGVVWLNSIQHYQIIFMLGQKY